MKVLIVGGGGREHAIAVSMKKSKRVEKLYCVPGNAGIAQIAECDPTIGVMEFGICKGEAGGPCICGTG